MPNIFKISGNPEGFEDLDAFHKIAQQIVEASLMVALIQALDTPKKMIK